MTKVVLAKKVGRSASKIGAKSVSVGKKNVRDSNGQIRQLRTLDAGSPSFGSDLTYVFGKNVAKARRENRKLTGVSDVVPAKG